jgi:two-component system chemotaxis response regulator CheB
MPAPVKVLLAEDSSLMRLVLSDIFAQQAGDFVLLDTAQNGKEALEKTCQLRPDVLLLDLFMPDYDGVFAIEEIMRACPTPILLLTGASRQQMPLVFEGLEKGAFDFLLKPQEADGGLRELAPKLLEKVRQVANINLYQLQKRAGALNHHPHTFDTLRYKAVLIGASTGGTGAIEEILRTLPVNFPVPIVIAQHMPAGFIHSFADRLDKLSPLKVKVARLGEPLAEGVVYILPGEYNSTLRQEGKKVVFDSTPQQYEAYNCPSVDALFLSGAAIYGSEAIALLLSGMGRDGVQGMAALQQAAALNIAQDEASSVIFGMPKEAIQQGLVQHVVPLQEIGFFLVGCLS